MKRLFTSIATSLPLYTTLFTLLTGTVFHFFLHLTLGESSRQNIHQLGSLLASQLAAQSAQSLLNQDTLSLQVAVSEIVSLSGVANAYIVDAENRPLTEKITTRSAAHLDTFSTPVVLDGELSARAIVELDGQLLNQPYHKLFVTSLTTWLVLSTALIFLAARLGGQWRDRLALLTRQLPVVESPEPPQAPAEIGMLERQLTPLLLNVGQRDASAPKLPYQSIISVELRGLSRLETQLSQSNFHQLLDQWDNCVAFILRLYQGSQLITANQTMHFSFSGSEDDDHPLRALYAAVGLRQLITRLETASALKLDAAFAITSGNFSASIAELQNALLIEQQLKRAESLLKVASIHELTLDNASATHPALDHIALLEPLNPEHTLFRCDGLSETAQTLVQRQLAFFKETTTRQ